jgi:hypothetical protein
MNNLSVSAQFIIYGEVNNLSVSAQFTFQIHFY